MNIGLIDIDGHSEKNKFGATIYPNLALCKIAAYHKSHGDNVEWATQFEHFDILYMSKVFNFSEDDTYVYDADKIIKGGTGYDIKSKLPDEIDRMQPCYDIYPHIPQDYAYGFLTRGCPNKCPWCFVPIKEGSIQPYMDVDEIATNGRTKLVLMDNNILAAKDYAKEQFTKIIKRGYRVDFNQALDARLVTDDFAKLLGKIKWLEGRIRFGCDTPAQVKECERAMTLINKHGFKGEYFLYTMIGGKTRDSETDHDAQARLFNEAYTRINYWWMNLQKHRQTKKGSAVYAYAQPYRDPQNKHHKIPQWQKDMAGWVNKRMIFTTVPFSDFSPRKDFKCNEYFNTYNYDRTRT